MDAVILVLVPVLFLTLAASMLAVSQLTGFFQFNKYSRRRRSDSREILRFMTRLESARRQEVRRSRELETLSSRLQVNNMELARLNGMKSKFLSMVAHDMRTPLASIKGFGQLLERQRLGQGAARYVGNIVRSTEQMNRLMADLTDLAVIEAGKLRMEKASFDLAQMFEDVVPGISVIAQNKGVRFSVQAPPSGLEIVGDRFRLVQALMNFLNNAVKFTPPGGKVELSAHASGRYAAFRVKDSGPGIHPSEKQSLFEKFYQSKFSDQKARRQGWGLGLSIAQEIVRAHGGEIGAESAGLGKGSTFWYRIPLKPARAIESIGRGALILMLAAFGVCARAGAQQGLPLEEKARFEKALQEKAESVLLHLLGPGRARVVVDASLDFTRIERFDVRSGSAGSAEKSPLYIWQSVGAQASGQELLPGVPELESAPGPTRSYERQNSFPSSFVRKLNVMLILDRSVDVQQGDEISRIVSDVMDIQPGRGDVLNVVRAPFAPAWKTVWYTPESASLLMKYGLIGLMMFITLVVVAVCFLKLAEAMDSMAQAQGRQLQTDFGPAKDGALPEEELPMEAQPPGLPALEGAEKIVFDVRPEQAETLLEILRDQDPDNLALVTAHLPLPARKAFLSLLPARMHGLVLTSLGRVRFVEREQVLAVKEELEKRLENAVGGRSALLSMIADSGPSEQRELLRFLEIQDQDLARAIRSQILLFEDLAGLEGKDWPTMFSAAPLEEWGLALKGASAELLQALEAQLLPKTWAMLQQALGAGRSAPAAVERAQEKIIEAARRLILEGRIADPAASRLKAQDAGAEALAAQEEPRSVQA
ncbi:MAG: ATP-binding protein [Elusimicrobiota bacterium]|jgi:signal transduction histidine kinase